MLTGVEVREGDEILFRGGWWYRSGFTWLVWEDGREWDTFAVTVSAGGQTYDLSEEAAEDPDAPAVSFLLELVLEPELTHRGVWNLYFLGLFCSALGAAAIWFADPPVPLEPALPHPGPGIGGALGVGALQPEGQLVLLHRPSPVLLSGRAPSVTP